MAAMPKKFPAEFKRDVVTVARRGKLTRAEIAADFGISIESVKRWVRQAATTSEQTELV
jgi:transposase-like protein